MEHSGAKLKSLISSLLFFFSIFVIIDVSVDMIGNVSGDIFYVNTTGDGGAFTSIQDAINASSDGDTVFVYNGTYYENVVVNKTINLTGEDRNNTIIDGGGNDDVIMVEQDLVNISGFYLTNCSPWWYDVALIKLNNVQNCTVLKNRFLSMASIGIYVVSSEGNNIIENLITNTKYGIQLVDSSGNIVSNNNITNSTNGISIVLSNKNYISENIVMKNEYGIDLYKSFNNTIFSNRVFSNRYHGIYLNRFSNYTYIYNNTVSSNGNHGIYIFSSIHTITKNNILNSDGILVSGYELLYWNTHIIENNTGNGKPIYYYKDTTGITVPTDAAAVICANCTNFTIKNINAINVDVGIVLGFSHNNHIYLNNISLNNRDGIILFSSSNNNISENNITFNRHAIYLTPTSDHNVIFNNNISSNKNNASGVGIKIHSSYNTILNNEILLNDGGIMFYSPADNNTISNNNISLSTGHGIDLWSSCHNKINGNIISSNNYIGITLTESSDYNDISANNISFHNIRCISLVNSYNNLVYHNNLIDNGNQGQDNTDCGNQWDDGYPLGGNYWSDYSGIDNLKGPNQDQSGRDGIGDTNYSIDSNSFDNYPLMEPYNYQSLDNFTILKQGWNLISIPFIQVEQNLQKVLEMIDGYYDAVQWYNSTIKNKTWKHHRVGKPFGNDLSELNETMGFWIHITNPGDTIFLYNGTQPTENHAIYLHKGWNLIGYPSVTSYNRTEGLNNLTIGIEVDAIWTYDSTTQKWIEIGESDFFEIGKGYYIHAKNECVWEVPL